jgi:hypothetical protein
VHVTIANMRVSHGFESGRIDVLHTGEHGATLAVPADSSAPGFRQWFAFDVAGRADLPFEIVLDNARDCTWGDALGGAYKVYASDGSAWTRLESHLDHGRLVVRGTHRAPRLRLCYYPPYPTARLSALRRRVRAGGGVVEQLAETPGRRSVEVFRLGRRESPVWLIAHQHPGESMAGWFAEGLLEWLTSGGRAQERLLARGVAVVPRMNPDGIAVGNHRTTPLGRDLNRMWAEAEPPVEVAAVRAALARTGASFFVDVHGDERLPWVFGQPADGLSEAATAEMGRLEAALLARTPDFQTQHRYPYDPRGRPSLAFASNWVHHTLGCSAVTLEMPFSDHLGRPDPRGFFPARARRLGAHVGRALSVVRDTARE